MVRIWRLLWQHVKPRTCDAVRLERLCDGIQINDLAACRSNEDGILLHARDGVTVDHAIRFGGQRRVNTDDIRFAQQLVKGHAALKAE